MQIEQYLAYLGGVRRYSPRTQEVYRDVLKRFEDSGEQLTPTGIRNYEVSLLDAKGDSARTVDLHLSVLSGYCRWAMRKGLMDSNPVRLVPKPKQEKRLPVFYREADMKEYFASTAANADAEQLEFMKSLPTDDATAKELYSRRLRRLIVSMLYGTGLRRSELISLNRSSVDFSRKVLSVRGKGDKMREIPLTSSLCQEISLYLSAAAWMLGDGSSATPLLRTPSGGRLYPVFCDRAVKQELGGEVTGQKSPHILRHTLATELLEGGADLNSIKELLGHSSLAATQVYTHNSIERLRSEYNKAHPRANKTEE